MLSSNGNVSALSRNPTFAATLTATYGGTITPNTQIHIRIDGISIWGVTHFDYVNGTPEFAFGETTPDHTGQSAFQSLQVIPFNDNTSQNNHTLYNHLVWNPADGLYQSPFSATRSFNLIGNENQILDGFEVFGVIEVVVPEPASASLSCLLCGAAVLVGSRRRLLRVA